MINHLKIRKPANLNFYIFVFLYLFCSGALSAEEYVFEKLGRPYTKSMDVDFVLYTPNVGTYVWSSNKSAESYGVTGINIKDGSVKNIDLSRYKYLSPAIVEPYGDKFLYIYGTVPGRFYKYNILTEELTLLGVPFESIYWQKHCVSPDGKIYIGVRPDARLLVCDPESDTIRDLGRIAGKNKNQQYLLSPVCDSNGLVYCPVGLHHSALWVYNPNNCETKQILPEKLLAGRGIPKLIVGKDNHVYGRIGSQWFKCFQDSVSFIDYVPQPKPDTAARTFQNKIYNKITSEGKLVYADIDTNKTHLLQTGFEGLPVNIYTIASEHRGIVFGSTGKPGRLFSYNKNTGQITDYGRKTTGKVQIYDILPHDDNLYLSSYVGGNLDFVNINDLLQNNARIHNIASLYKNYKQERILELRLGPDEKIYAPSRPVKGHIGGALIRIDPETKNVKVWRNIIENQSCSSLVGIPGTDYIFVATTVSGGSGSVTEADQAAVFLWDTVKEKIIYRNNPVKNTTTYAETACDGKYVYAFSKSFDKYLVFDPVRKKIIKILDHKLGKDFQVYPHPIGPDNDIIIVSRKGIFSLNTKMHNIKFIASNIELKKARYLAFGIHVKQNGDIYYGLDGTLWRFSINKD